MDRTYARKDQAVPLPREDRQTEHLVAGGLNSGVHRENENASDGEWGSGRSSSCRVPQVTTQCAVGGFGPVELVRVHI